MLRIHGSLVYTIIAYFRTACRILSFLLLTSDVVEHLSEHLVDLCCLALDLLLPVSVFLQLVDYN